MKIRNVFIYFLLFIPTYCSLIPNNKVITDSNSDNNDFNLVEGITYKVVHLKSDSNLDSSDNGINVNSISSLYQYWILRKANDGGYNIINVESGLNLDCDGEKVYVSSPGDNSMFNPYQNWIFTKIKDNIYNIVHVTSGLNLDSNGKEVYISSPEANSKNNIYQQWLFEPSKYNITAVVMDMKYPPDLKDKSERYKSHTSLLSGKFIFENEANATLEQTIDKTEVKLNSYTLEIRKSDSIKETKNVVMSFNIGREIFGLLGLNTGYVNGVQSEFNSFHEKVYKKSVTEAVSYHISQKIKVQPFNSVMINSTVDKININVQFEAKIKITGKADRMDESGNVVSMTDVEVNALRCYLRKENYDIKNIKVEGNSLIIDTAGTLEVNGYGLDSTIKAVPFAHKDPEVPEVPNDPDTPNIPVVPKVPEVPVVPMVPESPNNLIHFTLCYLFLSILIVTGVAYFYPTLRKFYLNRFGRSVYLV